MKKAPLPSPKSSTSAAPPNVIAPDAASPASAPPAPSPAASSNRPPLHRLSRSSIPQQQGPAASRTPRPAAPPPSRDDETTESEMSDSAREDHDETESEDDAAAGQFDAAARGKASPDEVEIERLRRLQLQVLQQQQRARNPGAFNPSSLGVRRPSPIKEEPQSSMSPTLQGAFSSPLPTGATVSTESTESAKTIRGSMPPTPANFAMRTPSYPFPTVPNTPRTWSSPFHQPFTSLSPTVSAMYQKDVGPPRERLASESSTPAASSTPFAPAGHIPHSPAVEDPRFPSPNMYDLVLQLNAEPGLAAWWSCVTTLVQDWYGAERATLAVPADSSDIENIPWGQKTTFNNLLQESRGARAFQTQEQEPAQPPPSTRIPERRPKLPMRHSFAGPERSRADLSAESPSPNFPTRPQGPLRAASYMPQSTGREHPLRQVSVVSFDGSSPEGTPRSAREAAFSDPDFSSVGGDARSAPPLAVYPVLRALDHEPDALIDNAGINRVLERGRLVTLTRDYSTSLPASRKNSQSESDTEEQSSKPSTKQEQAKASLRSRAGNAPKPGHAEQHDPRLRPRYEEYEQFPSSPWAQSPAPSPAIQNDPTENPFFTAGNVDEDTFNPSASAQDYSQFGLVEAIGVDKASTVIHIPLIHPTLSQPMQPSDEPSISRRPSLSRTDSELTAQSVIAKEDFQRRAPIAILSILSPVVPYPRNLTTSLKLLGPHLATSFSIAYQFSNAQAQVTGLRDRRLPMSGFAPMANQEQFDDLLHIDLEHINNSAAGSMTSPSDYSGRSKYSPGNSIGGTPGWDPSALGFTSKHSVGSASGHLAGSEAVEGYFDAKKRAGRSSGQSAQEQSRKAEKHTPKRASVVAPPESGDDDALTPRNEPPSAPAFEDNSGQADSSRRPRLSQSQGSYIRGHSLLHSYGADFTSSFQSLPAATTPGVKPPPAPGPTRDNTVSEVLEMPPPSESLLRTIIDSLPVQIFTALPNTGALTWVNSKFLVYRGHDSRQVLQEPWDAIHPEDKEAYLEQWIKSLRTGQQLQQKVRLQRFDGHYRWFYVRVAPLKNKRQQIVHWIGTNMDFHEQHLAELNAARQQETAASEAKYKALANSSPQIVFVVSNRRGLTFCNSQWITYSGQAETQALGSGFLEHVHPDDVIKCKLPEMTEDGSAPTNVPTSLPPEHGRKDSSSSDGSSETERAITSPGNSSPDRMEMPQAKLSKLAGTGILRVARDAHGRASYSTEVRLRSKDGDYRWHLVRILLEKALAEDSNEETWYGTATDINDHKLLEQTLKETMDAKTRFLSNMSHEIRTPLNGVSGMVNFLLDSPLNTEQLEHVNIIKASTDSLLNLINDILDLSKVEAGMIKLDMAWMHIPSLLEEVNDLNMGLAIQKGLELNYLMEEGVPSMVKGDKFRIRQVLLNVVGNAIKFTQKGEIFVRCRPCPPERSGPLKPNESMVQFEVIDTGKGFNESEAKYLFKRFSQIDASSTRQHGGTGLGLAISMQFVELHGGKMDARSVPGKGSVFFFTMKFGLPSEGDGPPAATTTPGTPSHEPVMAAPTAVPLQKTILSHKAESLRGDRGSSISSDQSESVKSPVPSLTTSERTRDSPSLSSGSSEPSVTESSLTGKSSLRSERSSASSFLRESPPKNDPMRLALPSRRISGDKDTPPSDESSQSLNSESTIRPTEARSASPLGSSLQPPMYSILVVCPLNHSLEATIRHIKSTLPPGIPHQITGQPSLVDAQRMVGGDDPVLFTHVVLVLHDTVEVIAIMDQILSSMVHEKTSIVVVSDPAQKRELMKGAPAYDFEQLLLDRRLEFIYRPLKPSKFAVIFDPQKQRELSTDRNQDSAQQVVVSQKLVFEELKKRIGGRGHKVLLVEDNAINQTVILKYLAKIQVDTETVLDGVQCTDAIFSKPPGYYSIVLCDLHMPNKDGYQTCREIRRWEKRQGLRRHPIIALSANVLGDVYAKCVEAGFNSYVTKPVDFKELSLVMTKFMDPADPSKQPELMKIRK